MVIGFKPQFVEPILNGTKLHTIRQDKNHRWQKGIKMHMATGVRTKNYKCFAEKTCVDVGYINIDPINKKIQIASNKGSLTLLGYKGIETLAKNDSFNSVEDFWAWFNKPFTGKLIYWVPEMY